jgi:hypothetical protein
MSAKGSFAESLALQFLRSRPPVARVEDVRHDRDYQRKEIDFVAHRWQGDPVTFEVKHDFHMQQTGNFPYELLRVHHTAETPAYWGWTFFSKADHFLVVTPEESIYVFTPGNVRRGMQAYVKAAGTRTQMRWIETDEMRTTCILLVPLSYIPHHVWQFRGAQWLLRGAA